MEPELTEKQRERIEALSLRDEIKGLRSSPRVSQGPNQPLSPLAGLALRLIEEGKYCFFVLRFNGQIYLFEFKVEEVAGPGSALKQKYAPNLLCHSRLHLDRVGIQYNENCRQTMAYATQSR